MRGRCGPDFNQFVIFFHPLPRGMTLRKAAAGTAATPIILCS
jgi:hypothetical protein